MATSEVFRFLQPYCNRVAKSPTIENISELQNAISSCLKTHTTAFQEKGFLEYLIFPLKLSIQRLKNSKENIIIKSLDCMALIFDFVILDNKHLFVDIFDTCCILLSSRKNGSGKDLLASSSEELKSCIVSLKSKLVKATDKDTFSTLYADDNLSRLGHSVSLLLAICEFENGKPLRIQAAECLQQLTGKGKNLSSIQHEKSSKVFCSFIPGISISLSRIITSDSKLGQRLSVIIIETWQLFLRVVMKDGNFEFLEDSHSAANLAEKMAEIKLNFANNRSKPFRQQTEEKQTLRIGRDKQWLENTQSKIRTILETFLPLVAQNNSLKIRSACVSFIKTILSDCSKTLAACLPISVEVLAGLLQDDYEEVAIMAHEILQSGQSSFEYGYSSLHAVVEESLYERLLSLPRVMQGGNEKQKLMILNAVLGYITLLGDKISKVFNSLAMLEKVVKAFLQTIELNLQDAKIVEEKSQITTQDFDFSASKAIDSDSFERRFKNFSDPRILKAIKSICHSIGKFSDLQMVVDFLLELFRSSAMHRKEAVLLINEILRGQPVFQRDNVWATSKSTKTGHQNFPSPQNDVSSVVQQVISTYLSEEFWYLPSSNVVGVNSSNSLLLSDQLELVKSDSLSEYWRKGISFEQLNSTITLICLMIDGIATCSTVLTGNMNAFLIKVLYPLLEKHGNENAQIAQSAHNALVTISRSCQEASVTELITHNADYIINAISMSFRHLTLFSSAPCVLSVVLSYCNADILPLLSDVIDDVFHCMDCYQDDIVFSLMRVLSSLVKSVKEWFADKEELIQRSASDKKEYLSLSPVELKEFLSEYCKLKLEALGQVNEEEGDEDSLDQNQQSETTDENEAEANRDEKKMIPPHFKAVITALEKCQHFLPSKDMGLKLLVLGVIELGIQALRHRRDDLLPVIHTIWPSLVLRLKDQQPVIIARTLEVVCVMVDCSEDFMRQRIRKDFLPVAADYLKNQLKSSHKSKSMYKFSHAFKLQVKLIDLLGSLVLQLELSDKDLFAAASCCTGYLDCRQPQLLQSAAVNAMKKMQRIDSDYIWLLLSNLYSPKELKSPSSNFKDVLLLPKSVIENEFAKNVKKILT